LKRSVSPNLKLSGTRTPAYADRVRPPTTASLAGYTLGKVDDSDKEVIRYAVTLKLKERKGKVADRQVAYAVALKTPVVVSRDP
jgi:hypothetical protein